MSISREQLELKFLKEYQRLNEQQQKAVQAIEGPVMVIAGPGTGKTQILACRIGKILLDTDVKPENILCLTYTEAGVIAMRKRLQDFIGPAAYKVQLGTFHSFCNEIIQDNLPYFEKHSLDPISELERIQLFKEHIDSFPKDHPFKKYRGDVYHEAKNMINLFSTMKREGWAPSYILEKINQYLASLPERDQYIAKRATKEFKKGELRTDRIEGEKEKMNRLRAAVLEFEPVQQLMKKRNRYDFEDMINWVIQAFEQHPSLLADYQERYQYILVDEYQDTSGSQNKLVELLISYWETPNIFVVGDDDQSIFRFQGANVANMTGLAEQYSNELLRIVLTQNYRSSQPILDVSTTLIQRNQERLINTIPDLTKVLVAADEHKKAIQHPPRIWEFDTQRLEIIGIAKKVQDLIQQGIEPGRIAIIYKEHKYGEELAGYLQQLQIPYHIKRSADLLTLPLIKKILLLLRYLQAEQDVPFSGDELLFELLHLDIFGIAPLEIAKLSLEAAGKEQSDLNGSMRALLHEKTTGTGADLFTNVQPLAKASNLLEDLIAAVPNSTLQQLLEKIIQQTGLLAQVMQHAQKHEMLRILTTFFDYIKEETHRKPDLTVEGLMNLIDLMQKEEIILPYVQISEQEKGVNLLTAHGSKGLEFQYVFIAGALADKWEKKRKPSNGYSYPDNLFGLSTAGSNEEELRRLFYVAITRAEEHLFVSYSKYNNSGKELEPSRFVMELADGFKIPIEKILLDQEVISMFYSLTWDQPARPEIAQIEEDVLAPLLSRFTMNVTALNNYLHCPLEFYYRTLIRIPSPKNESTEFGSAVHTALEKLFRRMLDSGSATFPDISIFIQDFEQHMRRFRESFTKEQFKRRMEYGQLILTDYYHHSLDGFNKIVAIERNIRNVVIDGIPLKGKLDKLEFDGKKVNVVDYKTGDPDKAKDKLNGPNAKYPLGGDYWRQAVFYKILVDNYEQRGWQTISAEFDFIEPDKQKEYQRKKIIVTPADVEIVKEQIKMVWDKIQAKDFYTGCGKEKCHWCNFVKSHQLAVELHELEEGNDSQD
ncbi:MAG: ATP-dependent helicase [Bacteroidetes bacterium]|nr:ATP-dependent helicase [Bacteroidota bacterium]